MANAWVSVEAEGYIQVTPALAHFQSLVHRVLRRVLVHVGLLALGAVHAVEGVPVRGVHLRRVIVPASMRLLSSDSAADVSSLTICQETTSA